MCSKPLTSIDTLLSISSGSIASDAPTFRPELIDGIEHRLIEELRTLLRQKNGFFAFESALHVLAARSSGNVPGIEEWNSRGGWMRHYNLAEPILFFAQDLFAGQFALCGNGIFRFDPETGRLTHLAETLEGWAGRILSDYNLETGWAAGREWQREARALKANCRLLPLRPFVIGGDYVAENLVEVSSVVAMEKYGALYGQIKDVPDGAPITVRDWMVDAKAPVVPSSSTTATRALDSRNE